MGKRKITWTSHFRERLMERFALDLNEEIEETIEQHIAEKEPFTVLKANSSTHSEEAKVYAVEIEDKEVMIITNIHPTSKKLKIISALRRSWFHKDGEGGYYMFKKKKRKIKQPYKGGRAARISYKVKKAKLLESDCESSLI